MQAEQPSREELLVEIESLRRELQDLKREKADLEILLETTTEHSDTVEADLHNRAEEAVRQSQRRLAQFLEAVPVGVFVVDANGKSYYANQMAQQILGKDIVPAASVEELPSIYQAYVAETNQLYPSDFQPLMRALNGETLTIGNMEIHQGDKIVPLEVWATPIFDEQGKVVYAIAAFQDITERKRAETERERFTHELFELNQAYERFVPRQLLQFLQKESIVDVQVGDQVQQEMSVLFADIRDFTALSEKMTPEENFQFLNSYLSRMEPAIIEHQGFIDKYMGDGIMALFSGEADDAVKAGLAMLEQLAQYNQERQNNGARPIRIGIGINTGSLIVGTVGGKNRMDATVISDAVNLASRIEELTKYYGVSLLISHKTFSRLEDSHYEIRLIDRVKVKGKSEIISVFEVFNADPPEIRASKLLTKRAFEKALLLYNLRSYNEAAELFKDCLYQNKLDRVAQIYLERCQENLGF